MDFDDKEYRKRVLTAYKGPKLGQLQAALRELKSDRPPSVPSSLDLAELYDISTGLTDPEISVRVADVASCFASSLNNAAFRSVAPHLVELNKLLRAANPGMDTTGFWASVIIGQQDRATQGLADFAAAAAHELRALGVVTLPRLRALARGSQVADSVPDADLAAAVQTVGITVVAEVITPQIRVPGALDGELRQTSCRSILSAIFGADEPAIFHIVDGYRGTDPQQRLTLQTVIAARDATERRAQSRENDGLKKALGLVVTAARTEADIQDVVLAWFIDQGRQLTAANPLPAVALRVFVERTGIDNEDAARILLMFEEGSTTRGGFPEVQAKVAEGQLKDARRLYNAEFAQLAGSTTSEQDKAEAALVAAESRVTELRVTAKTAVEAGDLEAAGVALTEALTLCADDESLAAMARDLPPAAPLRFAAVTDPTGRKVLLSWEPGFGSTEDVAFQMVRKSGSAPANNRDGTVLAGEIRGTAFEDPEPPVAAELHYAVSATRGGGYSPVAVASLVVLPPVQGARVSSDETSVTVRWDSPPDARQVKVVQTAPDGRTAELPVNTHSSATSTGLATGATYTYVITALYAGADGSSLSSAPVRLTGVPRGEARAVASFTLGEKSSATQTELEATWGSVEGFEVEIWHFPDRPDWGFRSRVPLADIRSRGIQLAGREAGGSARRSGVHGLPGAGLRYYLAVTVDGDDAIVGQCQELGICPPMEGVTAERFGDQVLLAWEWPGPEYDVRVAWSSTEGSGERVVTLHAYRQGGGSRIDVGGAATEFTVSSVTSDSDSVWSSPETTVHVSGTSQPVPYTVAFQRRLIGPALGAILTFDPPATAGQVEVVVIGQRSQVMPRGVSQGQVLARARVVPGDTATATVEVSLPRGRGPVWVRAFSETPGTRLVDPPASHMKGE